MSSQYPFPRCSDSKPKVTWLFHAAKVQLFFETTKFYGIFSVTITIISIFHAVLYSVMSRKSSTFAADFQVERLDTRLSHSDNRLPVAIIFNLSKV